MDCKASSLQGTARHRQNYQIMRHCQNRQNCQIDVRLYILFHCLCFVNNSMKKLGSKKI